MHWEELENLLASTIRDSDKLSDLFIKVSSDLSYARTYYPNRSVRLYLNNLTQRVFDSMRIDDEKFTFKKVSNFFSEILPQEIYNSRKALLSSLAIFLIALFIGVISSRHYPDFCNIILGDAYVEMTEENIAAGDPMAVYKDERKLDMVVGITTNNLKVALLAFVLGIFGALGTVIVLLYNGIMVGAFQYFFFAKGLFWESFLTIWIHGTIEISAIIIAGGAGIVLGSGLLFPKTYTRSASLQVAALRSLRILTGTVPLFIIAGILESFVTRQTDLPDSIRMVIILLSALLIIFMWIIYPYYYIKSKSENKLKYALTPSHTNVREIVKSQPKSYGKILADSFFEFNKYLGPNLKHVLAPTFIILLIFTILKLKVSYFDQESLDMIYGKSLSKIAVGGLGMSIFYLLLISYTTCMIAYVSNHKIYSAHNKLVFLKSYYLPILIATCFVFIPYALIDSYYWVCFWIIFSIHFYVILIEKIIHDEDSLITKLVNALKFSFTNWLRFVGYYIAFYFIYSVISGIYSLLRFAGDFTLFRFLSDLIKWHKVFDESAKNSALASSLLTWCVLTFTIPLFYYLFRNLYYSINTDQTAIDLKEKLKTFGKQNSLFELR